MQRSKIVEFLNSYYSDHFEIMYCEKSEVFDYYVVVIDICVRNVSWQRKMFFISQDDLTDATHRAVYEQSSMYYSNPYKMGFHYQYVMASSLALIDSSEPKVLMIGLGGGDLLRYFQRYLPQIKFTVVEIDDTVIDAAKKLFSLEQWIEHADCYRYLAKHSQDYDLILNDCWTNEKAQLRSRHGFDKNLAHGGAVVYNWSNVPGTISKKTTDLIELTSAGYPSQLVRDKDNVLLQFVGNTVPELVKRQKAWLKRHQKLPKDMARALSYVKEVTG